MVLGFLFSSTSSTPSLIGFASITTDTFRQRLQDRLVPALEVLLIGAVIYTR